MCGILGAVDRARLGERIAPVDLAHREYGPEEPAAVSQRDGGTAFQPRGVLVGDGERQRPARGFSPAATRVVQGSQPMLGYPRAWSALTGIPRSRMRSQTASDVQWTSGFTFTRPNGVSRSTVRAEARSVVCSRRMELIQASSRESSRRSGSTLRNS